VGTLVRPDGRKGGRSDEGDSQVVGRASVPSPNRANGRPPNRSDEGGPVGRRAERDSERSRDRAESRSEYGSGGDRGGSGPRGRTKNKGRKPKRRKSPMWARLCVFFGVLLMVGSFGGLASAYVLSERYINNIERQDLLGSAGSDRKAGNIEGPLNILLIGSDSREGASYNPDDPSSTTATVKGQRSDTLMLFHIPKSMDRAYGVSFPRDLRVDIPPVKGKWDGGKGKLNSAFTLGGPQLTAKTIKGFTGLDIDYAVIVNFAGVTQIVDAVGGVEMNVPKTIESIHTDKVFKQGVQHFDGKDALDYVRQRKQYNSGDFARMANQQELLKALVTKASSSGTLSNPLKMDRLLQAGTKSLVVDESMPIKDLAYKMRELRPGDVTFFTVPVTGSELVDGESFDFMDETKAPALFDSIKQDSIDQYLVQNPPAKASY
jgi:LCP family protein required for cell wall assembly